MASGNGCDAEFECANRTDPRLGLSLREIRCACPRDILQFVSHLLAQWPERNASLWAAANGVGQSLLADMISSPSRDLHVAAAAANLTKRLCFSNGAFPTRRVSLNICCRWVVAVECFRSVLAHARLTGALLAHLDRFLDSSISNPSALALTVLQILHRLAATSGSYQRAIPM